MSKKSTGNVSKNLDAKALHNLGAELIKSGKYLEASSYFKKSLALNDTAETQCALGYALLKQGNLEPAIRHFNNSTALNGKYEEAYNNLGIALTIKGDLGKAIDSLEKAIHLKPNYAQAYKNLAIIFIKQKKFSFAIEALQKAIAIIPDYVEAYLHFGAALRSQGRVGAAIELFNDLIRIEPGFFEAHMELGNTFRRQGNLSQAITCYKKAISINPGYSSSHYNLGVILQEQGDLDEAVLCYKKTLSLTPGDAKALCNLGVIAKKRGEFEEAVLFYRKALTINPDYAIAHSNLGNIFKDQGKLPEASKCYQKALAIDPGFVDAHNNLIFCIDLFSPVDSDLYLIERKRWAKQHAEPLLAGWKNFNNIATSTRKIRIGYVGADFREHSAANIFGPAILQHDSKKFQVYCYAGNIDEDWLTEEFRQKSSQWLSTAYMDDAALATKIRSDEIDILVDLAGHSGGNRLLTFARKPAPIQITAWGYPHGTSMTAMDYLFADSIFIPLSERSKYSEQIIDLSCVIHLDENIPFPKVEKPPAKEAGEVTFGSFNRLEKHNLVVFSLWAKILLRLPKSKLLIKTGKTNSSQQKQELEAIFSQLGIGKERLILQGKTSKQEHLEAHNQIDIMLDPFPHNGGMTTLESVRMGVPVLTCESKTRCPTSASILHVLGLDDWRARDEAEYLELAIKFAKDIDSITALKRKLPKLFVESALGNSKLYVAEVEAVYRQLWQKWCDGQKG
ncbi:MAG: tetratricopeptide repeat protein [Magnetococcales bacterium]|nr:tetratricopeptide repeat protein [Magnetococcales bacterium]